MKNRVIAKWKRYGWALLPLALILILPNWLVHQPRQWQQKALSRLPAALGWRLLQWGNANAEITDALGLSGHDNRLPYQADLATNLSSFAGLPVRSSPKAPDDIIILKRRGFTIGYSPSLRRPVWVAYRAHPRENWELPPRPSQFKSDPEAPHSAHHRDYTRSGYDRGHMAPNLAIASRYGREGQLQTFRTSNVCAQSPALNRGPWSDLEYRISELWPQRYGTVWVVVGAISHPDEPRFLQGNIDIPMAFYMVVTSIGESEIRAFAVYMPQSIRYRAFPRAYLVSIAEIEELSGLDFLADLPDELESVLERTTPTRLWPCGVRGAWWLINDRYLRTW